MSFRHFGSILNSKSIPSRAHLFNTIADWEVYLRMPRKLFASFFFAVAFGSSAQPSLEMPFIHSLEDVAAQAMQEPTLVLDDTWAPAIQAFIDRYFPDPSKMPNRIYELLNELQTLDDEAIVRAKLNEIEKTLVEEV